MTRASNEGILKRYIVIPHHGGNNDESIFTSAQGNQFNSPTYSAARKFANPLYN